MSLIEKINKTIDEYNLKLITNPEELKINSNYIEYKCNCGNSFTKTIKQFLKVPENDCCKIKKQQKEFDKSSEEKRDDNLIWKKYENIYISNTGIALNMFNKELTLDSKNRYYVNGKHQYVSRIMALAFKIDGYENLDSQSYVVSFKNENNSDFNLDNLIIIPKSQVNQKNGSKSRQTDNFKNAMDKDIDEYLLNVSYKIIKEIPYYIIFEDGSIYNKQKGAGGKRFICGSKNKNEEYLNICTLNRTYKFHRLVCMAWHPINGKENYDDYSDLQVNHIDGNKINNHSDNLEWVTQSENIVHAYENKLNKKVRAVLQFTNNDGEYGDLIGEFPSIAKASRETKIPEHEIREISKGKFKAIKNKIYLWKYKNEDETEEFRKKYSSN
jgi:hypothetical protein